VLSHQIVVAAIVPSCWRGKKIKEKHKHRIKKIREFIDEKIEKIVDKKTKRNK
jgi:hypothetical protein